MIRRLLNPQFYKGCRKFVRGMRRAANKIDVESCRWTVGRIPERRKVRLAGYDYSQPGAYFVTICARNRESIFGEIVAGQMQHNQLGKHVASCWTKIPSHFIHVVLDALVVMPNHLHGILLLSDVVGAGHARPLPVIIGSFKSATSKQAGTNIWQRSYWEHIIRDENELNRTRHYIEDNPVRWLTDQEHPALYYRSKM